MFTNSPSDRVQVVGRGDLLHPGSCALCGSGNCEEGYVDTGIYYDWEGQVYYCITCTRQIAEVIGCLLPEEANILKEQVNSVLAVNGKLTEQLEAANERLRAFDVAFASVKFPDDSIPSDSVVQGSGGSDEVSEPVTSGTAVGESETPKSVKVRRRSNPERAKLLDVTPGNNGLDL